MPVDLRDLASTHHPYLYKNGDDVILKFKESVFTRRDLKILEGPTYWMEDGTLQFFLDLIESDLVHSGKDVEDVVFLSLTNVQLIKLVKNDDDDDKVASQALEAHKVTNSTKVIVFPLNSSEDGDSDSGIHWSIVMFYSPNKQFYHFDSMYSEKLNLKSANMLIKRISPDLEKIYSAPVSRELFDVKVQPQDNKFDCGIHVLMNAVRGVHHLLDHGNDKKALKRMGTNLWSSTCTRNNLLNFVKKHISELKDPRDNELKATEKLNIIDMMKTGNKPRLTLGAQ